MNVKKSYFSVSVSTGVVWGTSQTRIKRYHTFITTLILSCIVLPGFMSIVFLSYVPNRMFYERLNVCHVCFIPFGRIFYLIIAYNTWYSVHIVQFLIYFFASSIFFLLGPNTVLYILFLTTATPVCYQKYILLSETSRFYHSTNSSSSACVIGNICTPPSKTFDWICFQIHFVRMTQCNFPLQITSFF